MQLLNDLLALFTKRAVLTYARARLPRTYIGPALFPNKPVNELSFEYWKQVNNRFPVMANVQAYGAEAEIASREGAEKVSGEFPPIKRKIPLNERLLIALKREGAGDADLIKNQIYNDLDHLIDSVHARLEKMRMDALTTGRIELIENGMKLDVDYNIPATHKAILADDDVEEGFWDNPKSDPISLMQNWTQVVELDTGIRPTRALTSQLVVSKLIKNKTVRQLIYGDWGGTRAITVNQLNELLVTMQLPQIATYDLLVRSQDEKGKYKAERFFPLNMFIMLPESTLGDTLIGPTAESLLDANISSEEAPGLWATVDVITEPVGIWTKVAAAGLPTFPMADTVFQAQVLSDDATYPGGGLGWLGQGNGYSMN